MVLINKDVLRSMRTFNLSLAAAVRETGLIILRTLTDDE